MTPFGTPELVPDWHDSHAMRAYVPPSSLGHWVRTDLGVRTVGMSFTSRHRSKVHWVSVERRSLEWSRKFVDTHGCNLANGAFSEEKGKRLVASSDHPLYGTRRAPTVATLDKAIVGPIVLDCLEDQTDR